MGKKLTMPVRRGKGINLPARTEQQIQQGAIAAHMATVQYMLDTLQIAIHQTEGWGYDRIQRLTEAWKETQKEYSPAVNAKDPAADVYREHMDRVMLEIIGKRQELIPFEQRYPELTKVKYGKRL